MPIWWGEFPCILGAVRCWEIASLQLWVQRVEHEWRLAFCEQPEHAECDILQAGAEAESFPQQDVTQERYLYRSTADSLRVTQALAPRLVVVRSVIPLHVPGGESVSLYTGDATQPLPVRVVETSLTDTNRAQPYVSLA